MCRLIYISILCTAITFVSCQRKSRETNTANEVKMAGAMRNVMMRGQLEGTIKLDTITNRNHLYGIGPIENLAGEVLIADGHSYISRIINDSLYIEETYLVRSPFFVYGNVNQWKEMDLPDSIENLKQVEAYLDLITAKDSKAFAFKLTGRVETANIHVVNLPTGTVVKSPEDAHRGKANFSIIDDDVDLVGFFSRKHKGIFTHHDTFIHAHLINKTKTKMGHLEGVKLSREMKLFISVF